MRVLYIPVRQNIDLSQFEKEIDKLPKRVGLVSTIQFIDSIREISRILKRKDKQVFISGQGMLLGCNLEAATRIQDKVCAFLYLGSGNFHPLQLALALKKEKPIFTFNPLAGKLVKLDWREVRKIKARQRGARIKVLSSDKIGVLVSTKQGQCKLDEALKLKEKLEKQGKKIYLFLFDNFQSEQLENWQDLAWLNTACPGLSLEQPKLYFSMGGY
ncbi:MAG: diphthamide synthesis protein [Candidatus Pacearchaeota archaeon]